MTACWDAETTLREAGRRADDAIDLADTALAIAALDRPDSDSAPYRSHLESLAAALMEADRGAPAQTAADRAERLRQVLADRFVYSRDGETYDDLRNANLMDVIDRRKGLPVALGILYLHTARRAAWPAHGLTFPGHFLIRIEAEGSRTIIDPFHRGRSCSAAMLRELIKQTQGPTAELEASHYETVGNRAILLRLQNNLKLRHLRAGRIEATAEVVERMLLVAPDEAALWRERGMIDAHRGRLGAAIRALETFLELAPDHTLRQQTAALLQRLRSQLN